MSAGHGEVSHRSHDLSSATWFYTLVQQLCAATACVALKTFCQLECSLDAFSHTCLYLDFGDTLISEFCKRTAWILWKMYCNLQHSSCLAYIVSLTMLLEQCCGVVCLAIKFSSSGSHEQRLGEQDWTTLTIPWGLALCSETIARPNQCSIRAIHHCWVALLYFHTCYYGCVHVAFRSNGSKHVPGRMSFVWVMIPGLGVFCKW